VVLKAEVLSPNSSMSGIAIFRQSHFRSTFNSQTLICGRCLIQHVIDPLALLK
jgi:hypothetical protein